MLAPVFLNREQAGRALAVELSAYADRDDTIVLALPRGGVPVGYEVTRALRAPLERVPREEAGRAGTRGAGDGRGGDGRRAGAQPPVVRKLRIPDSVIRTAAERESEELGRRDRSYRGAWPPPDMTGRS